MQIHCKEQMQEAVRYACANQDYSLLECIMSMVHVEQIQIRDHTAIVENEIYRDFAPLSFAFARYIYEPISVNGQKLRKMVLNGGIIYHGKVYTGGGAPTFSVNIDNSAGWQIHT